MAAWSPAATPSRVCPSMIRAVRPATDTSASSRGHEPGPDGRAVDRRHDRLRAVDDVEHQVPGLAEDAGAVGVVPEDLVDQLEASARPRTPDRRPASSATLVSGSRSTASHTSASCRWSSESTEFSPGASSVIRSTRVGRAVEGETGKGCVTVGGGIRHLDVLHKRPFGRRKRLRVRPPGSVGADPHGDHERHFEGSLRPGVERVPRHRSSSA